MSEKPSAVFFDIETFGGVPELNGLNQLGAAHVDADGTVLATFNEYANASGYEKEPRCMEEFWNKNPDLLADALKNSDASTNTPKQVVELFFDWVVERCKSHPDLYLVSDNPAFDAAFVQAFAKRSILYVTGQYRDVVDCGSWYNGMGRKPATLAVVDGSSKRLALSVVCPDEENPEYPDFGVQHTHRAQDDAALMGKRWWWIQKRLEKRSE